MDRTTARPNTEDVSARCPAWCETAPHRDLAFEGHSSLPCHVDVQYFEVGFALAVSRHDDGEVVGTTELELTLLNRAIEGGTSAFLTVDDAQRLIDLLAHGINELRFARDMDLPAAAVSA